MIVFDASAVVSAALRADSVPEQALLRAATTDLLALSAEVDAEIAEVLGRPIFARAVTAIRRAHILDMLRIDAAWFSPTEQVIVSGDSDLLSLEPWRGVRILEPAVYLAHADSQR